VRRLLVTGGAGFIGSNFVHHWCERYPEDRIVVLDCLTYAGNPHNLLALRGLSAFRFVRGDIADQPLVEKLLRDESIDTLVHFAAESHVDRSITGPDAFIATNVIGTHSLLKAARRVWLDEGQGRAHRFHHVSTDEVYGSLGPADPAFSESTPYAPNSPYSASKAASDHLVRAYHHTFGLAVTTSNCSNNYGPRHFPEKLIPLCIVNILEGRPLPIYGDGRNVRDWLHVADHCRGIELVLARGTPGEVYNLGGGAEAENITLVRSLCALVDAAFARDAVLATRFPRSPAARGARSDSLITFVKDRAGHDRRYAIDCTKARREIGYEAEHALARGLEQTVAWYLDNEAWWRAVLDGSYQQSNLED
jgi:dTDP-glucose 4,6-dehydratase